MNRKKTPRGVNECMFNQSDYFFVISTIKAFKYFENCFFIFNISECLTIHFFLDFEF